ncbi:SoxR reducing system protein RseC [Salmonella enterica subsp. enterica serovar Daytona]|uniref:SoxR reducing system protein RseC n=4 Tax=Enterobacteriaceae TaxID=543 RepID=A0A447JE61_SALET|nr:SoxR reducing system protein RseC [Salmonella enterica subsp. enterica serovar Daytona]
MIKEWATVVSWQNGQAVVSCDVKASCSSCASRAGCGSRVLNKLGPQTTHTIVVPSAEPLAPGQKVELGIAEKSLLGSALLVYMSPLAGLFLCAALFQMLFGSDLAALSGAVLGGVGGFLVARGYSRKLAGARRLAAGDFKRCPPAEPCPRRNYLNRNAPVNVLPNGTPAALGCCPDKHALFLRCGVLQEKSEAFSSSRSPYTMNISSP